MTWGHSAGMSWDRCHDTLLRNSYLRCYISATMKNVHVSSLAMSIFVHLFACHNSRNFERIFMKFGTGEFY